MDMKLSISPEVNLECDEKKKTTEAVAMATRIDGYRRLHEDTRTIHEVNTKGTGILQQFKHV